MTERLGAWKNAPLAYVLAEVRTEQLSDLSHYRPELAAALRSEFPIQRNLVTARLIATSDGASTIATEQENAWEFATPDNQVALILRPHGFVLHATTYQDHTEFLGRFRRSLEIIAQRIPSVFVNRLGLRYIDFIIPQKGEVPEQYVDARLNPHLDIQRAKGASTAMSLAVYPMPNGRLMLRYIRGLGQPQLPPELSTIALEKSSLMGVEGIAATQPTAILDIDRIREFVKREPLDPDSVRTEFQLMRDDVSQIFKETIITQHARNMWGAL